MNQATRWRNRALCIGAALLAPLSASAGAQALSHWPDSGFHDGFEGAATGPATDADASRFLAQATFGPSADDIAHLRLVGYRDWLDEQFAAPASSEAPYLDWVEAGGQDYISDDARLEAWAINSAGTPDPSRGDAIPTDQLRQRVAFALSEIFVVSNANGTLAYQPWALASFYDWLAADAFGNYRTLLEDVTRHPAMGIYLSMIENQKADPGHNIHPDENYAREVNQLFSIGLVQLNLDGTPKLADGQPIPTYDQETVRGFAAVFTGWNWNNIDCEETDSCCDADRYFWCGPSSSDALAWRYPMQPIEEYHDNTSDKQLLDYPGVDLPGGVLVHGGDAQAEMTAALDNIFHHPNVGPFIATRLIQRLVTSNPVPAYVQRVAQAFNDDGSAQHVRGDLRAVIRAILLDPEARYGQWLHSDTFGKLREPLLKATQLWRALSGRSAHGRIANLAPWPPIEDWYGEAPLRSPSVFNFFKPDFAQPGEIAGRGLSSPEFQILVDTMAVATPNDLFHQIFCYYVGSDRCWDSEDADTLQMDYTGDAELAAADLAALIDRYDTLLMAGQMSPFMRNVLVTRLDALDIDDFGADLGRVRVQHALYLIFNSPEYSIQK
ncbi:MAG TPA: DUF1800 family protein [Rhodanobacteraceae bacterium]|nr:DUF1800 family protein [Rhodanobacteraceae bacterium]